MKYVGEIQNHVFIEIVFDLHGLAFAEPAHMPRVLHAARRLGRGAQHPLPLNAANACMHIASVPAGMGCNQLVEERDGGVHNNARRVTQTLFV